MQKDIYLLQKEDTQQNLNMHYWVTSVPCEDIQKLKILQGGQSYKQTKSCSTNELGTVRAWIGTSPGFPIPNHPRGRQQPHDQ